MPLIDPYTRLVKNNVVDTTLVTTSTLDRHINEYFLFHSAKPETQEYISRKGFSSAPDACKRNLAGYAHEDSFGSTGIHFRETIGTQEDIGMTKAMLID